MGALVRFIFRSVLFTGATAGMFAAYALRRLRDGSRPASAWRAEWLSRSSAQTLRIFGVRVSAQGPLPTTGLLVGNHLSYLDILVISSLVPAVFVSKHEVMYWPVFGWFARLAGTIFVRRARKLESGVSGGEIRQALEAGRLVVLFPEGTTTDGHQILPFKSSLLEPAVDPANSLHIAALDYSVTNGSAEKDVCYAGDATFLPHFIRLMTRERIEARVRFAEIRSRPGGRKELAQMLHREVSRLRSQGRPE